MAFLPTQVPGSKTNRAACVVSAPSTGFAAREKRRLHALGPRGIKSLVNLSYLERTRRQLMAHIHEKPWPKSAGGKVKEAATPISNSESVCGMKKILANGKTLGRGYRSFAAYCQVYSGQFAVTCHFRCLRLEPNASPCCKTCWYAGRNRACCSPKVTGLVGRGVGTENEMTSTSCASFAVTASAQTCRTVRARRALSKRSRGSISAKQWTHV